MCVCVWVGVQKQLSECRGPGGMAGNWLHPVQVACQANVKRARAETAYDIIFACPQVNHQSPQQHMPAPALSHAVNTPCANSGWPCDSHVARAWPLSACLASHPACADHHPTEAHCLTALHPSARRCRCRSCCESGAPPPTSAKSHSTIRYLPEIKASTSLEAASDASGLA